VLSRVLTSDTEIQLFLSSELKNGREFRVEDLASKATAKLSVPSYVVAKNLYYLQSAKKIKLYKVLPPSITEYLKTESGYWFWGVIALVGLTAIAVYLFPENSPLIYLRYPLGIMFMGFLPGYAVTEALYSDRKSLAPLERSALSIGLSLTFVPLAALLLNYTPWGIRLGPMLILISIITLGLSLFTLRRKFALEWKTGAEDGAEELEVAR
jgi:uncharacterized membrane protein